MAQRKGVNGFARYLVIEMSCYVLWATELVEIDNFASLPTPCSCELQSYKERLSQKEK